MLRNGLVPIVVSVSPGRTASRMAGSARLTIIVALFTTAFGTCTSRCFMRKAELCCHGCVVFGTGAMGKGPNISILSCSVIVSIMCVWLNDAIGARNASLLTNLYQSLLAALLPSYYWSTCLSSVSLSTGMLIWSRLTCFLASLITVRNTYRALSAAVAKGC